MKIILITILAAVVLSATPVTWTAGTYDAKLLSEDAFFAPVNNFGVYEVGLPGTFMVIFAGSAVPGDTTTFTMPVDFGFAISGPGGDFFSEPTFNMPNDGHQHFMQVGTKIRIEDLPWEIHWDLNDGEIDLQRSQVPEPSTFGLMGLGLLGLFMGMRRRTAG